MTKEVKLRLVPQGKQNSLGLEEMWLILHIDGKDVESIIINSGQAGSQALRSGIMSRSGSMEPLPEGHWSLGTVEWADGKNNYNASWGAGLGPVWISVDPKFQTSRAAIGIHLDANRGAAPGTAGCVGVKTIADLKKVVSWFETHKIKSLTVNYALGTVETTPPPPATDKTSRKEAKPPVKWVAGCPNISSRNGVAIKRIISHYTAGGLAGGAINWFLNPTAQVSSHYIIDKDGTIYQMVKDSDKAWHCYGENADSIGIEHVSKGEAFTPAQEKATVALHRYLMAEYHIDKSGVTAHRFTKSNIGRTACPAKLFGEATEESMRKWIEKHLS